MRKIVLCGLVYDKNLGDAVISKAAQRLYKIAAEKVGITDIEIIDLLARISTDEKWDWNSISFFQGILLKALGLQRRICAFVSNPLSRRIAYAKWYLDPNGLSRVTRYFREKLCDAALIVIVGGGVIGYDIRELHLPFSIIMSYAEKNRIPVVFNAVGVAGDQIDRRDFRFKVLKDALNSSANKMITARDDVYVINKYYLDDNHKAERVADSAVWISEVLNIEKKKESNVVGLGLIRGNAFMDYGGDLGEEALISLWIAVVKELDRRNIRWKFFCNGLEKDYALGQKILNRLHISNERDALLERPKEIKRLVEMISTFRAVICHRMHACVISYSLNIPVVAISWNAKLQWFFNAIGYQDRVFGTDRLDSTRIVDGMEKAIEEGYDQDARRLYRDTICDSINRAVCLAK